MKTYKMLNGFEDELIEAMDGFDSVEDFGELEDAEFNLAELTFTRMRAEAVLENRSAEFDDEYGSFADDNWPDEVYKTVADITC